MKSTFKDISFAPYIYTTPSLSRMSLYMILALIPHIALLAFTKSYASLCILVSCVIGCCGAELLSGYLKKKHTIYDGTALLTGLCAGLFLPQTFPVLLAALISFLGMYIFKHIFGGIGCGWVHPAMAIVAVAYVCYSAFFPAVLIDGYALQANGSAFNALLSNNFNQISNDAAITSSLNTSLLEFLHIQIPEGYVSLFWDTQSAIPAFRFNIITLLSSVFLISASIINWIIPVCFFLIYGVLVYAFSLMPFGSTFAQGDILFALLTSGTLFCGFFILQYHGTVPLSVIGKVCYGIFGGIIAFLLCGIGGSAIGMVFTVLLMNCATLIIEIIEDAVRSLRKRKLHEV